MASLNAHNRTPSSTSPIAAICADEGVRASTLRFLRSRLVGAALAGFVILLCRIGAAQEVQVLLRNGDRLTGRILSEDARGVTLTNVVLGRLVVPAGMIERRIPAAPAPVSSGTNQVLAAAPGTPPWTNSALARQLENLLDAYRSNRIAGAQFHRERARLLSSGEARAGTAAVAGTGGAVVKAKQPVHVSGELQAGLDLAFATKNRQLYTSRMKLVHTQDRLRTTTDYSFTYGRTDGEVSANRMDGTLKTDCDLTRVIYVYNQGGGGYDKIRKLNNYFQIGPGLGDHLFKLTNFTLNIEGGANFQRQSRADGTETDIFYYRLAEESKFWMGQKLTLDEKFEYFPQWNNISEFKLRFEANLKYWLRQNLFLNLSMIDLYDTMTVRGVDSNDIQIRSTIGVKF